VGTDQSFAGNSFCGLAGAITVLVGLPCLAVLPALRAADKTKLSELSLVDIRVQDAGFGRASAADIKAILQSAARELCRHCPNIQLPGIDVYYRSDHPQTDLKRTAQGRIAIGLSARDNHWAQYAFQFAHEYCHALINYGNNRGGVARRAPYPNLWLEESLCETGSLFTLQALSRSWLVAPPYQVWRDYAPWFSAYLEERQRLPGYHLPAGTPFMVWFRAHEPDLRGDGTRRDRNTIIAAQLLPIFEKEPRGWGALAFFSRAANPNQSLSRHFAAWHSNCPPKLQHFVAKLAGVFDVQI